MLYLKGSKLNKLAEMIHQQMITPSNKIISKLNESFFKTSLIQPVDSYFPDFLKTSLNNFIEYYKNNLYENIDLIIPFQDNRQDVIISKIINLSTSISETIDLYYNGKFHEATLKFNNCLDDIFYDDIKTLKKITKGHSFYRARKNENRHFSKEELFHIAFQNRHIVSTNRYSLPGFPSLYLADSTYTCWEEFDRYKLRDLWFSKIQNQIDISVIEINHYKEFINEYYGNINDTRTEDEKLTYVISYISTFPLTLACTIKVKFPHGNFKPEYIIPQLLLQYISKKDDIDGIKFPSTKVNYSKIRSVKAYNYVFPVKSNSKFGFCEKLVEQFYISEPTSLELEEIIFNTSTIYLNKSQTTHPLGEIELINNKKSMYRDTSFGKLEISLRDRNVSKI